MKVIKSKTLQKILNSYASDTAGPDKNTYLYTWYRGVYSGRIFGLCIIRNLKTFNELKK